MALKRQTTSHAGPEAAARLDAFERDRRRIQRKRRAAAKPKPGSKPVAKKKASARRAPRVPLPPEFFPRDGFGQPLCTAVRAQAAGDPRCTAFAIAAAMEAFECRVSGSSSNVPFVSIDDLHPGKPSLFKTAKRAEQGVVDEVCRPPGAPRCSDDADHEWVLEWNDMSNVHLDDMIDAMRVWLVDHGPIAISVRMFADFDAFQDQLGQGLVYTPGPGVPSLPDAHALCIVGYGSSPAPFWIVKNSRDVGWGHLGFGRIFAGDARLQPELVVVAVKAVQVPP
jgi:hypothetical protein